MAANGKGVLDRPSIQRAFFALLCLAIATYLATAILGGGDAYHGRVAVGHFFVAHHEGAPEHEVSALTFYVSLWSLRLLIALWAIGLFAGIFAFLSGRRTGPRLR